MTQELMAEPMTAMGAFDEPGDIGNDEAAVIAQADNAEIGRQRGEGVVGDFGPCGGDARDERGFAGIREANEPDVREQLQLEAEIFDLARLARLYLARRAVGRRSESRVAQPSTPPLCD